MKIFRVPVSREIGIHASADVQAEAREEEIGSRRNIFLGLLSSLGGGWRRAHALDARGGRQGALDNVSVSAGYAKCSKMPAGITNALVLLCGQAKRAAEPRRSGCVARRKKETSGREN